MNELKLHIGIALLACMLSSPSTVLAQAEAPSQALDPPSSASEAMAPTDIHAQLLNAHFQEAAEGSKTARRYAGLAGVIGGTILLGLGGWRLAEDPAENDYTRGLGVMFTTLGMVDLTTGIIAFKREPHEEERARRYQEDLKDGMSAIELARYEGEFQASTRIRESQRMLVRWNGLTHALAGVIVMSFSAIPDMDRKDKRSAYIIGGVFMGAGLVSFGFSFRETPNERAFKSYQKKKQETPGLSQQVSVAPVISRHSLGLGVNGRF